jgi:hypothetical protein
MTPLAYLLLVAIPLSAIGTIALALRRGRPSPWQGWETPRIRNRLAELAELAGPAGSGAGTESADVRRERRGLQAELLRRGHRV